ncbi:malate synthase A [Alsobacter soli]|nr:malate synthase A [Alsobacter soli]
MSNEIHIEGLTIRGAMEGRASDVITPSAAAFLAAMHRAFEGERQAVLQARAERRREFDAGQMPDFSPETQDIRDADWRVAPVPADLLDRRIEIAGPPEATTIVEGINSGARVFVADLEDALSPSWANLIAGQANLIDLWAGRLEAVNRRGSKHAPRPDGAAVMLRPRGWRLPEAHVHVDGGPIAAALFDLGLYLFHNAGRIRAAGKTVAVYLPKVEDAREARLWNDVLAFAEHKLDLTKGSVKATVLIETLPAAFQMDEILHAMRERAVALNCGRFDLIFSFVKCLGKHARFVTPDRASMVMGSNFLAACSYLLVKTCHRRGALALGGKIADLPVAGNRAANRDALNRIKADKQRAALEGFDGVWVSRPDLARVAQEVFHGLVPEQNQLGVTHADVEIIREDMLSMHPGRRTESGLRGNIRVVLRYLSAWLEGQGAVTLHHMLEDAGTAEIARVQLWQWVYHRASLSDGRKITPELFGEILQDEAGKLRADLGEEAFRSGRFAESAKLLSDMTLAQDVPDFLTLSAYDLLAA